MQIETQYRLPLVGGESDKLSNRGFAHVVPADASTDSVINLFIVPGLRRYGIEGVQLEPNMNSHLNLPFQPNRALRRFFEIANLLPSQVFRAEHFCLHACHIGDQRTRQATDRASARDLRAFCDLMMVAETHASRPALLTDSDALSVLEAVGVSCVPVLACRVQAGRLRGNDGQKPVCLAGDMKFGLWSLSGEGGHLEVVQPSSLRMKIDARDLVAGLADDEAFSSLGVASLIAEDDLHTH